MSQDRRTRLRDILDELDKYFQEFEEDVQNFARDSISAARLKTDPFVAGFSFRLGPEGRPSVQLFGDSPLHHGDFRSPMSEQVLDKKNGLLRLVFEMPGVKKEDIQVEATDDSAVVTAEREPRKYRAEVELEARVQPDSGRAEYNNGVLEITFSLRDKANNGYKRVNIV